LLKTQNQHIKEQASYYKTAGINIPSIIDQERIVVCYKGRFDNSTYWQSAFQTIEV
jgi:hypothetical protein